MPVRNEDLRSIWTYRITRDSVGGKLANTCDLWAGGRPQRIAGDHHVVWGPKLGANYLGEHALNDIKLWFRTVPDTDLECIIVETYADDPKAKSRKREGRK